MAGKHALLSSERKTVNTTVNSMTRKSSLKNTMRKAFITALTVLTAATGAIVAPTPALAANGSDFKPGNIISDNVFHNASAMAESDIQNFLTSKVKTCASGYTCLKDYAQATPNIAGDRYCSGYTAAARETAATIIKKVANSCKINPQVLIVLLEKEQSLVTSVAPSAARYQKATGFSCPDTAPCDPNFSGFMYQVYYAGRQFNVYEQNPNSYRYKAKQNNAIQYHPNLSCGTKNVYIENQATANLYIYTPYTPNQAALNNLYGTGDACSAYGNRNFWRLFTDWFGSTQGKTSPLSNSQAGSITHANYRDLLERDPEPGAVAHWQARIANEGITQLEYKQITYNSLEYKELQVKKAYQNLLKRTASQNEINHWVGTKTDPDVLTKIFVQSEEYYVNAGKNNNRDYVSAIYRDLLGREAGASEREGQAAAIARNGRGNFVHSVWMSTEASRYRINAQYVKYLQRPADEGGLSTWVPVIQTKGDNAVRDALFSSGEYLNTAVKRFPY